MIRFASLVLSLSLSASAAFAGIGEVICDDTTRLQDRLVSSHGLTKRGYGMRGPDALMEVWISPTGEDWSLVQSYADGTSCIVAMGEHWQDLRPVQVIPATVDPS